MGNLQEESKAERWQDASTSNTPKGTPLRATTSRDASTRVSRGECPPWWRHARSDSTSNKLSRTRRRSRLELATPLLALRRTTSSKWTRVSRTRRSSCPTTKHLQGRLTTHQMVRRQSSSSRTVRREATREERLG